MTKRPKKPLEDVWTQIGQGLYRKVFSLQNNPDWVVKLELDGPTPHNNMMEFAVWTACEFYDPGKQWLAPCWEIYNEGRILVQRKVETPPDDFEWPERVPNWLTDLKKQNFGLLDGRLVSCDYGCDLPLAKGISKRMKKAEWWDERKRVK